MNAANDENKLESLLANSGFDKTSLSLDTQWLREEARLSLLIDNNSRPIIVQRPLLEQLMKKDRARILGVYIDEMAPTGLRFNDLKHLCGWQDRQGVFDVEEIIRLVEQFIDNRSSFGLPFFGEFRIPDAGIVLRSSGNFPKFELHNSTVHSASEKEGNRRDAIDSMRYPIDFIERFQSKFGVCISTTDTSFQQTPLDERDIALIFKWAGVELPEHSLNLGAKDFSPPFPRFKSLLLARLAEKSVLRFYESYVESKVEDRSLLQLYDSDQSWRAFDIWADGPVDVKNTMFFKQNVRQSFVPKFKRYSSQDVRIAGVASLDCSYTSARQIFLGELTASELQKSLEAVGKAVPLGSKINISVNDHYLPAWAFRHPFPSLNYSELSNVYTMFAELPSSILSALIANGTVRNSQIYLNLNLGQQSIINNLSDAISESSYSKLTIILFAISYFTSETIAGRNPSAFIRFYRKLFSFEALSASASLGRKRASFDGSNSGGLHDPLNSVSNMMNLLERSGDYILNSGLVFQAFHVASPYILIGKLDSGKKVTVFAYCGGKDRLGHSCNTFPLIIGENETCKDCGKLVCTSCKFCSRNCDKSSSVVRIDR